ncbi:MAG TPA: hypothetical protein VD905_19625 [Flavobacteriales bacterium]|nr:hypothetical protein [Flavobacteriales bacterium]
MSNNSYEKKAVKKGLLGSVNESPATKGNISSTLTQTGLDLLLGGIAGSFVGSLAGRYSLLGGAVVTGASYYMGSRLGASFGIGIMSGGYFSIVNGVGSLEGTTMDNIKARSKVFAEGLKQKLFLDKILKSKKTDAATTTTSATAAQSQPVSGTEQVRYFMYPQSDAQVQGPGELDMSALDRLNAQVAESAKAYKAQSKENPQQVSGLAGVLGDLLTERIL